MTLLLPLIPVLKWFCAGLLACVVGAFRRGGPRVSLLIPLLALPLALTFGLCLRREHENLPRLYGAVVFAIGCTLMFISTLPGLYYWIKFRLSRKKGGT